MSIKNKRFEVGNYVEINDGIHDAGMPENRRDGLVVEVRGKRKDKITVMFSNGVFLDFHKSSLKMLFRIEHSCLSE